MEISLSRRNLLKLGAAAAAITAVKTVTPQVAHAAWTPMALEQCVAMSPVKMAETSGDVMAAWSYIQECAAQIKNPAIRVGVQKIIENPAPTVAEKANESAVLAALKQAGYLKEDVKNVFPAFESATKTLQPFYSAPGSGYTSHHSYPGGLATHTAVNVYASLALYEDYQKMFNFLLDRDVVLAAQILHDLHKPWVFQWQANGASRAEQPLAGTGQHHVLSIAESLYRGIPAEVVVAQACAHDHPGSEKSEASVVGWLKAAAIIARIDPVQYGVLSADGKTLPLPRAMEGFITHLGDHDFVLSVPVVQWLLPVMKKIAVSEYGMSEKDLEDKPFHSLRNYVFSQITAMRLYHTYQTMGEAGLIAQMKSVVCR